MVHVSHVSGNLKGGVDAELGEKTIIVGVNGAGKSRILNTLELALLGFASDIVGRAEVRREADLVTLTDDDSLSVSATLSDGRVAQWSTERTETGAKRAKHVKPINVTFPVSEVRSALAGSVETARKWLLSRVALDVSREDVTKWLSSEEAERYTAIAGEIQESTEVDVLLGVAAAVGAKVRQSKAEIKATETGCEKMAADLSPEPVQSQLDAAEKEASALWTTYQAATQHGSLETGLAGAMELRRTAIEAIEHFDQLRARYGDGAPPTESELLLRTIRETLVGVLTMHIDNNVSDCFVCGTQGPFDHTVRRHENQDALHAQDSKFTVHSAKETAETAIHAFREATRSHDENLENRPATSMSAEDIESAWREASEKHQALRETSARWESVRSSRDTVMNLREDIHELEGLQKACSAAIDRLLKTSTEAFVKKVQSYLPKSDKFVLQLVDGNKEVCRFGFNRDGVLHTALSGAEWARLTLALACASVDMGAADTLRIFTPEERAFDPATLTTVLRALSDAPGQVVMTSPVKPKGRLPKGWTLIEVDGTVPEVLADLSDNGTEEKEEEVAGDVDILHFLSVPEA
jgi:hypothetical protein